MIYEKISIDNELKQDLNYFNWDYNNKEIIASFYLSQNSLKNIINYDNNLIISDLNGNFRINNAKIEKIKISSSRWGDKWVSPEITLKFYYPDDKNILFFDFDESQGRDCEYLNDKNKFNVFLSINDYQIPFEDFDFYISNENSLFPFEFYISNKFKNQEEMNNIYDHCINGEEFKIIFLSEKQTDFFIIEKKCNLDFIYKNIPTDNYKGYENNIVIYGGDNNSNLNINDNETSFSCNLLSDHLKEIINEVVKNNHGSLRIEL